MPIWWIVGVIALAVMSGRTTQPFRVDVCLVASGADAEDVTTNVWSDQIEQYFERWPGSYCGSCGKRRACPKE